MWTWLAVGVTAYLAFLAGVIVVLRAARTRSRAERAADAGPPPPRRTLPGPDVDEPAASNPAAPGGAVGAVGARGDAAEEPGRAHPEPHDTHEGSGGPPPEPPATRVRG